MSKETIAIVGCGPRGMFALEQLLLRFSEDLTISARIYLFDTSRYFGAGPVYDLRQPSYARMNFSNSEINAWSEESCRKYPDTRLRLTDWLLDKYPELANGKDFAPRAMVGEYLHDCYQTLLNSALTNIEIFVTVAEVLEINEASANRWEVKTSMNQFLCDEVMISTGHEGWRSPKADEVHSADIPSVFPLEKRLSLQAVPAHSEVSVKGFSLTWIDVALALTEGRGGTFEGDSPASYTYRSSGNEPRHLYPHSRTGRPMLAKPLRHLMNLPDELGVLWDTHRKRMKENNERQPIRFAENIRTPVFDAANSALEFLGERPDCTAWFKQWNRETSYPEAASEIMRESVEVACGLIPPSPAWALAEAWRKLYPEISRLAGSERLRRECWEEFSDFAREMERIAFGPPAENLGRILALIDAGFVDLSRLTDVAPSHHIRIDARIPAPNETCEGSPVYRLIESGKLRRVYGCGGIRVDQSARPLDENDRPVEGLAIIGRATEGYVIGNDTLSRSLHSHVEGWAQSVLTRSKATKAKAPISC